MENIFYLIPLFFTTAVVYSSVGFGGGSTYLALLALFGAPYTLTPKIALVCNLIVVAGGLYHYIRERLLPFRRIIPFVITSLPLAYLGGRLVLSEKIFFGLLGFALAAAGVRLLFFVDRGRWIADRGSQIVDRQDISTEATQRISTFIGLSSGALLGFLSGLTGIGGGVFLAPILYFLRWGHARQIAAASSFFIFVNSASGLMGQLNKQAAYPDTPSQEIFFLLVAVFLGGQIGSRLSIGPLSFSTLQRVTAVLILFVSGRIFWEVL